MLRLSYTLLSQCTGDMSRAIAYFQGDRMPSTPAMETGQQYHDGWQRHVEETGKLPDIFRGHKLVNPVCEAQRFARVKVKAGGQLLEVEFVYSPDIYTGDGRLIEFKTGTKSASHWVAKKQLPFYGWLLGVGGINVTRGYVHAFDPWLNMTSFAMVWLTEQAKRDAQLWALRRTVAFAEALKAQGINY